MSERPVYTKSRSTKFSRKRQRGFGGGGGSGGSARGTSTTRFHGAFKGGFSAGHFNSVGSSKGWTPTDTDEGLEIGLDGDGDSELDPGSAISFVKSKKSKKLRKKMRKQKIEDYMDDEDANDWGGPTSIKKEYTSEFGGGGYGSMHDSAVGGGGGGDGDGDGDEGNDEKHIKDASAIGKLLNPSNDHQSKTSLSYGSKISIGKQLLRRLGWREKKIQVNNTKGDDTTNASTRTPTTTSISYAYVPLDVMEGEQDAAKKNSSVSLLASKRLKRIELKLTQQGNQALPPPKIDTYGIGYEPFHDAPEFKAHRDMRRKRAQQRAVAATSIHGDDRMNVYRTSDLYNEENDEDDSDGYSMLRYKSKRERERDPNRQQQHRKNDQVKQSGGNGNILAYEATEDFVGDKTVSGFALHDDDDDVYDDYNPERGGMGMGISFGTTNKGSTSSSSKTKLRGMDDSQYHHEVIDAGDSDIEDDYLPKVAASASLNRGQPQQSVKALTGALSAWASGTGNNTNEKVQKKTPTPIRSITSDGRPVMTGFTLGGESNTHTNMNRYAGPDVPKNYEPKRHQFPQVDSLEKMKILSSQMKDQLQARRRQEASSSASKGEVLRYQGLNHKSSSGIQRDLKKSAPMAGPSFAALSNSLKDRFQTSSGTSADETRTSLESTSTSIPDPRKVTIASKTLTWQPSSLLCKRLNVSVPRVAHAGMRIHGKSNIIEASSSASKSAKSVPETREESFFRNQVLGQLDKNRGLSSSSQQQNQNQNQQQQLQEEQLTLSEEQIIIDRPTMEYMKSIFEASSDDDMSISDDEEDERQQ